MKKKVLITVITILVVFFVVMPILSLALIGYSQLSKKRRQRLKMRLKHAISGGGGKHRRRRKHGREN